MCEHEHKNCPRCAVRFHCKVGSVLLCQCSTVSLTHDERAYLGESYDDCLCANCMRELKSEYHTERFRTRLQKLFGLFTPKK